jgi:NAD(P)-dependent dehydrogenase (short-subunit alcohol dehydrogenase family)
LTATYAGRSDSALVTTDLLDGVVVVVAGCDERVATIGRALLGRGALLGVVSTDTAAVADLEAAADQVTQPMLAFRADPTDIRSWQRISAHLEQRLGPIDAVVADAASAAVAGLTFLADLRRRGHGDVIAMESADIVDAVIQAVRRTP